MNSYYLKRTGRAILTVWLVITLTFGMIRLLPGGPLTRIRAKLLRQGIPSDQVNELVSVYQNVQLDQPVYIQYFDYLMSFLQGDLGKSMTYDRTVTSIIAEAFPWTIFVMVTATILMFAVGVVIGALQAYKEGSRFDSAMSVTSIILSSLPFYILGIVLVYILGYQLNVFPTGGQVASGVDPELSLTFFVSALKHAMLPIISIVITQAGVQALTMRGNSIQILGEDYVRVARLRGLSDNRISLRYVARNAILPMYTSFLTLIGFNLGGSVILERVFKYPGVGWYMFNALQARDYPLMMGIFLIITTALVFAVYIADLTYGIIDPRVSAGDSSETY
ncbi:ABC transporter permease [Halogeometricum borinquense]|uniref:ABC transporter permease n=1 Tax=Halogeometricum borinquense TaxID=60847 RepID=A0A482TCT8_9EURY|nr:ABC transporter permease [Halogeometricum borinquense]RYJ19500.1 ABC transporter permease [Halogeometricum borinquense]